MPFSQRLFRYFLYWRQELLGVGFTLSSRLMAYGRYQARRHIENSIADPDLRAAVTPDYEIGCKRVLLSDDYYPTLERDNVELIDRGVVRFTRRGVVDAAGNETEADVVIFATGFNAVDPLSPTRIFGRGGREIAEDWKEGPEAYLGINVSGYPNLFLLMGPNTGLGHNSVIFMIESQIRYSVRLIKMLLADRDRAIDVRPEIQSAFNRELEAAFAGSVWSSGCKSWYQTGSGRQFAIWPGFTFTYWLRTLRPDFDRYEMSSRSQ
jgi:cation diffusion facilitator CzcD-associated flavoprotein CzcO